MPHDHDDHSHAEGEHDHDGHDHDGHDHDHEGHEHQHHGGLGHSHAPKDFGMAFAIGTALNLGFVVVQVVFGLYAHSLNAIFLLVAVGGITWEAVRRFHDPTPVAGGTVMWVAGLGIAINTATALLFMSGRKGDLNVKGAFLHMAADAAVSAGVVVAGAVIAYTGWHWLDPVTSLAINAIIVWGTWGLLRDSTNLALDAVPAAVHDLHIWALSTTQTALTVHLVKPDAEVDDGLLARAGNELREKFGIAHATIQLERGDAAHPCSLAPDHVV